jgi:Cof subfamily protein (haloacid dehalogenase superfamily)
LRQLGSEIKLIICDMDGTLLNSGHRISKRSLKAFDEARKAGIRITICSGRIFPMLEAYVKELNIKEPVITANGAALVDPSSHSVLWSRPVPKEDALKLMEYCKANHMDYSALGMERCFFSSNSIRIRKFQEYNRIASQAGLPEMDLLFFDENHNCISSMDVLKILIHELSPGDLEGARAFIQNNTNLQFTSSESTLLDVSARGVDKGLGVRKLAGMLNLHKSQICVFGDYLNDLPMFREAGFPIAMGNSSRELQKAAAHITCTNDEDGVAAAIEKYIV